MLSLIIVIKKFISFLSDKARHLNKMPLIFVEKEVMIFSKNRFFLKTKRQIEAIREETKMRGKKLLVTIFVISIFMMAASSLFGATWQKTPRIVFIVKGMQHPFWQKMIEGAEQAGTDLGMKVTGRAPVKPYDVLEQIRIMEDAITQKVDAIIIAAADSKGVVPGILKANKAGILVGASNTKVAGGDIVGWAGADNFDAAYEVAEYLIKRMGNKGDVIILEGTAGIQVAHDRKAGFDAAFKKSNIKVLASQTGGFVYEEGMRVMENLLQQFNKIDAVIAANDPMAIGAIRAMEAANRLKGILVAGFNGDDDAIDAIKKGKMLVTTAQVPQSQAYWAVLQIYMKLKGMPVPKEINVPTELITAEKFK